LKKNGIGRKGCLGLGEHLVCKYADGKVDKNVEDICLPLFFFIIYDAGGPTFHTQRFSEDI
jgi:hypothetical protein